jgi:hypothetical protein
MRLDTLELQMAIKHTYRGMDYGSKVRIMTFPAFTGPTVFHACQTEKACSLTFFVKMKCPEVENRNFEAVP